MGNFNAGAIEASLTLSRSSWTAELKKTKKEILDLEKSSITIGVDLDSTDFKNDMKALQAELKKINQTDAEPGVALDLSVFRDDLKEVKALLKELDTHDPNLVVNLRINDAIGKIATLRTALQGIARDIEIKVKADVDLEIADFAAIIAELDGITTGLEALDGETYSFDIKANAKAAYTTLTALDKRIAKLEARNPTITVDADTAAAMAELDAVYADFASLDGREVDIKVNLDIAKAQAELIEFMSALQILEMNDINVRIDIDGYSTAIAQLATLEAQVVAVDSNDINIGVDVDKASLASLIGSGAGGASGGGGGAFGLLKVLMVAIIALAPVLAAAMGGAIFAIVAFTAALAGAAGAAGILAGGLFLLATRGKDLEQYQQVADAIDSLKDALDAVLPLIADSGFGLMADAIDLLAKIVPTLVDPFNKVADMLDRVIGKISDFVDSPGYAEMIDFFSGFGVDMLESFLTIGGNLLAFFGGLFQAIAPFADEMMKGLEDTTAGWAAWASDLENNEAFQDWVDRAMEYGPMVLDLLGSIIKAFFNIGEALEPFAGPLLSILIAFFDWIANMDTTQLSILLGVFASLYLAFTVVIPLVSALVTGFEAVLAVIGLISAPVLLIVLALALLVAAVIYLWKTNEDFRNSVISIWNSIHDAVAPIVEDIVNLIKEHWGPISEWAKETWGTISDAIVDFADIVATVAGWISAYAQQMWEWFGPNILAGIVQFFSGLGSIISGAFNIIGGIFKTVSALLHGDWKGAWEGIKQIAKGVLQEIIGLIKAATAPLRVVFTNIKTAITGVWEAAMTALKNKWDNFKSWLDGKWQAFKAWVGSWAPNFKDIFADIKARWTTMKGDIEGKWQTFKTWLGGLKPDFSGMFDGIATAFKSVYNKIVGWWNGLSFSLPGFKISVPGPLPDISVPGVTISTPNIATLATGGYVDQATLALIGEGKDPEIVAPVPMLERVVKENSGANIDYGRLASAVASALEAVFRATGMQGITREDLERLIEAAGVSIDVDARGETGKSLAKEIAYQMRLLGFGGRLAG